MVELDKLAGDPVDVFVNDRLVARGEVLVLNDNFCVRVNEIVAGGEGRRAVIGGVDHASSAWLSSRRCCSCRPRGRRSLGRSGLSPSGRTTGPTLRHRSRRSEKATSQRAAVRRNTSVTKPGATTQRAAPKSATPATAAASDRPAGVLAWRGVVALILLLKLGLSVFRRRRVPRVVSSGAGASRVRRCRRDSSSWCCASGVGCWLSPTAGGR